MRSTRLRLTVRHLMVIVVIAAVVCAGLVWVARRDPQEFACLLAGWIATLAVLAPYRLASPAVWLIAAPSSWRLPGDESMRFIVSCAPATRIAPFLRYTPLRKSWRSSSVLGSRRWPWSAG